MQLNSVYLYPNKINVFTNADWTTERYRQVYNRNLKLYRSVDNKIDLQVRNSAQRATRIIGDALVFNIITRETKDLVLQIDCSIQSAADGTAYVVIDSDMLLALESGFYNYSLVQEDRTANDGTAYILNNEYIVTSRTPMYVDSQYGTIGTLEINGDVFGEIDNSLLVDKFALINPATTGYEEAAYYTSSLIDTVGHTQVPQSLHTFQIYFTNNYTGTIVIQGSLSEGGNPHVWSDVASFDVDDQREPVYKNVVGKYNFFRVRHYPDTATSIADFVVSQTILGSYTVGIRTGGRGYTVGDIITIKGDRLGGETPGQDLTITVTSVSHQGTITGITSVGVSYNGVKTYVVNGDLSTSGTVDKILYR
jgi:hypothetical protein